MGLHWVSTYADMETVLAARDARDMWFRAPLDLSGRDLSDVDFSGGNLAGLRMLGIKTSRGTKFDGTNLTGAKLHEDALVSAYRLHALVATKGAVVRDSGPFGEHRVPVRAASVRSVAGGRNAGGLWIEDKGPFGVTLNRFPAGLAGFKAGSFAREALFVGGPELCRDLVDAFVTLDGIRHERLNDRLQWVGVPQAIADMKAAAPAELRALFAALELRADGGEPEARKAWLARGYDFAKAFRAIEAAQLAAEPGLPERRRDYAAYLGEVGRREIGRANFFSPGFY